MNFIKTEYSFKEVFYPLEQAVIDSKARGHTAVCIIDNTTFGYIKFEKAGLTVVMTDKSEKSRSVHETCDVQEEVILIAKDQNGVKDLYKLFQKSTERYNRFNRIFPSDLFDTDLIIIGNKFPHDINRKNICCHTAMYPKVEDKTI